MDKSNGYERVAKRFIQIRGSKSNGIGSSTVRSWAQCLAKGSAVLDLGCGTGIPISKVLMEEGMEVYGVDASATLVNEFEKNFPEVQVACEAVEDSEFYTRKFDAVIAWGLLFLLSEEAQAKVIYKIANALKPGGKFLFTAPWQKTEWEDMMTGQTSRSLGAEKYKDLTAGAGLNLVEQFTTESENHYFHAIKI